MTAEQISQSVRMDSRTIRFLATAFGLSWGVWLLLLAGSHAGVLATTAPASWYALGGIGPSLAAFILIWREHGPGATRAFAARLLQWRVGWRWYCFVLLVPTVVRLVALGFHALVGGTVYRPVMVGQAIVAAVVAGVIVGLMEEFGWRGYLLPGLLRHRSAVSAAVLVGVVWGLWHLPLFRIEGTSLYLWSRLAGFASAFTMYELTTVSLSMLFTYLYLRTGGSLLLPVLLHATTNASSDVFFTPYRTVGDLGPTTWSVFSLLIAAVVVAVLLRTPAISPGRAVTNQETRTNRP